MNDFVIKTLIVTAAVVDLVRSIGEQIGQSATGMWTTPLSPDGNGPATHYISHGAIGVQFAEMLGSAESLYAGLSAMSIQITFEQCVFIMANSDISDDGPQAALNRMGLKMMQGETVI